MRTKAERKLSSDSHWATRFIAAILVTAPIAAGSSANAADFSFTTIDVPSATYTSPSGINNAGQIVGSFGDSTVSHGFLYSGGTFTQIDAPGPGLTSASGINDAGQIVGNTFNVTVSHGFLYSGGIFTPIDVPGASMMAPSGINNAGQIVGSFYDGTSHGFLYSGGSFTKIDMPGAFSSLTTPSGVNDAGQIVGYFNDITGWHGFLNTGGSFTQINVPGATYGHHTYAYGINNVGQIVGYFSDITGSHGFLATATGDPHFTTYDGVHYDYQGIGDFLLTRSTVDPFEVQVRTRSLYDDAAVTIMSQAAATLCNHKITFDIDRAGIGGFVWLDGSRMSLGAGSHVPIGNGCEILQNSPNDYRLIWNTGEMLDVTNQGTYLDLSSQLSSLDLLGPMEGLLGSELDPDSWRVIGGASLFTPVPEPSTLTLLAVGIGFTGIAITRRRAISSQNRSMA